MEYHYVCAICFRIDKSPIRTNKIICDSAEFSKFTVHTGSQESIPCSSLIILKVCDGDLWASRSAWHETHSTADL